MKAAVDNAFQAVPRWQFLPMDIMEDAQLDIPLPIGFGQTNSQPSTVAMMLDWLEVEPGNKILDVGSGSGWTSALLANLAGPQGKVIGVEIIVDLLEFGQENIQKLSIKNVEFHQAGIRYGYPEEGPYDRILVSAAAKELPPELIDQLAPQGRMVIPVSDTVLVIEKDEKGDITTHSHPGFAFVPLV